MKISAIASCVARRDFVDLHTASVRYGLAALLDMFAKKYSQTPYSRLHILKSLVYFDDAEKDPLPDMLVPLDWSEVRDFFTRETARFM